MKLTPEQTHNHPPLIDLVLLPVTIMTAAVDGYFEAFFMALKPRAAGSVSLADVLRAGGEQ